MQYKSVNNKHTHHLETQIYSTTNAVIREFPFLFLVRLAAKMSHHAISTPTISMWGQVMSRHTTQINTPNIERIPKSTDKQIL